MEARRTTFALGFLVAMLVPVGAAHAQVEPPTCLAGTEVTFAATGAIQTYEVPAAAAAVVIDATAGSGGDANAGSFVGGFGAHILAAVPVTGGETLAVIVGEAGESSLDGPGGGGGASAVHTATDEPLVVAGAGGGAGITDGGDPGQLGPDGTAGGGAFGGAAGTAGDGGGASTQISANAGGGGGFLSAGGTSPNAGSGEGGHVLPGDAAGGVGGSGVGDGGFGGGGGAGGPGGGGGGGYSGGGGGWGEGVDGGGGGGSFVAATGATFLSEVLGVAGDGEVTICATDAAVPVIPSAALALMALALLGAGALLLRRLG